MSKSNLRSMLSMAIATLAVCGPLLAAGDQLRVVSESDLKQWWQADPASPNKAPPFPIEALKDGAEGCMAVAFEIHSGGSVSNERIWRDTIPRFTYRKAMEQSTLLAVHQWHFIPAPANTNRISIYTYYPFAFTLLTGTRVTDYDKQREAKIRAECEMADFPQEVQAMISAKASANKKP